jgi:hypothetical protein
LLNFRGRRSIGGYPPPLANLKNSVHNDGTSW